jgi:hypothetical protein
MQLSKFGKFLSYTLNDELKFFDLYQQSYVDITEYLDTSEYPPSSIKSIPLDDQLIEEWSYGSTPHNVAVADVNQDGDIEIICSSGNELIVLNSKGRALWKESFSFEPLFFILDVTGDLVPEILVKSSDNHMEIQVFDGDGEKLGSNEFYSQWYSVPPSKERGGIGIFPLWSGNIDDDDSIEVICKLHAGYILKPRGLYAFEYPSFKEEWFYPVGPNLMTINVADIDNDGKAEIISGSEAPRNGNWEGGTDDFHAYVFAVTLQGEEIWTEQIGSEGYKRIYVAPVDLDGDGDLEIVGAGWSSKDNWGTLFVMDSKRNYIQGGENEFNHSLFLKAITDLDDDGDLEILAVTKSEFVIYNDKLREIISRNVSMTFSKHTQVTVNDIDADGEKEIVLTSEDPKLLILNTDLEEEWSKTFPGYNKNLQAAVVNLNKCKNYLLVLGDKLYAYTYSNNPGWPCYPWIIAKEGKINEIENALEEAQKYLGQGDLDKANEYVSQAEEVYVSIRSEGGLGEYYEKIEEMKKEIEASTPEPTTPPPETPDPTTPPPETPEPTEPPPETPEPTEPPGILQEFTSLDIIYLIAAILTIFMFIITFPEIIRRIRAYRTRKDKEKDHTWKTETQEEPEIEALYEYDVFICYASEDKEPFVRGLAEALDNKSLRVWYDEFMLTLGDKLTEKIDYGLTKSRYGVVILSKNFFRKEWTKKELDALAAREKGKTKVILPIWHGVTKEEVESYSPDLANRIAVSSDKGIDYIVNEILKVF